MFSKMCEYFNKKKDPFPDPEIIRGSMIFIANESRKMFGL